jgi:serine/threonine protein kinase
MVSIAKDFISHLLVVDPRKRYTAKQALAHPFIAGTQALLHPQPAAPIHHLVQTPIASTSKQHAEGTFVAGAERSEPAKVTKVPSNLAERVSANIRNRGLSGSRRRSQDATSARRKSMEHHPAPPAIPNQSHTRPGNGVAIREEEEDVMGIV